MGARRSNRGIGLELVRQLLSSPSNVVIAACRSPTKAIELQKLSEDAKGRLHLVALEVSDKKSIGEAAQEVGGIVGDKGVDYLINNAGIVSYHRSRRLLPVLIMRRIWETTLGLHTSPKTS